MRSCGKRRMVVLKRLSLATLLAGGVSAASAQGLAYEVATIRPNTSGSGNTSEDVNGDSYRAINQKLVDVLQTAFELQTEGQVIGLPGWAAGARFDISAKMDAETVAALKAMKREARDKAQEEMMQKLLVERVGLKFHHETRELPEYALVQAKGGTAGKSGLKTADSSNPMAGNMSVHNGKMEAYSAEIKQLNYFFSNQVHRAVTDRTGLSGKYDAKLEWTREDLQNSGADGNTERAPGLFTAMQEQMGLKLEAIKGPVDVVVIDHIEQPTEN